MALYLGEDKVKLNLDGIMYFLNLCSEMPAPDCGRSGSHSCGT